MKENRPHLPLEVPCWVDDLGMLYVGPLMSGPPCCPFVRFDGVSRYNDGLRPNWTWTGGHYGELAAYPTDKANSLIDWYLESESEHSHG